MDPHHGEISRAMRNRGVEIYVFGEVLELFYLAVCSNKESLTCTSCISMKFYCFFQNIAFSWACEFISYNCVRACTLLLTFSSSIINFGPSDGFSLHPHVCEKLI